MNNKKKEDYNTDIVDEFIQKLEKKYLSLPEDDEYRKEFIELQNNRNLLSKEDKNQLLKEYPKTPSSLIKLLEKFGSTSERDLPIFSTNSFSQYKDIPYSWEDGKYVLNSYAGMIHEQKYLLLLQDRINDEENTLDDKIRTDLNNVKWLAIGQMTNTVPAYLYIDFTPSEKGKVGQVIILQVLDENIGAFVIADSFDDFLRNIINSGFEFLNSKKDEKKQKVSAAIVRYSSMLFQMTLITVMCFGWVLILALGNLLLLLVYAILFIAYFYYLIKNKRKSSIQNVREEFDKFHKKSQQIIQQVSQNHNINLDYSIESINSLMDMIKDAKTAFNRNEISEGFILTLIESCGIYVGDTLLKNGLKQKGFKWTLPDEVKSKEIQKILDYPNNKNPFLCGQNGITNPIDKVLKYWNNGDEDNLLVYCKHTIKYF